jgi:protein involved in polysaccharide export with SLBB domain
MQHSKRVPSAPCLICLALLAGCASGPNLPPVPPRFTGMPATPAQYVIGPDDVLLIHFQYNPSFDQTLKVQPDGRITLPMIGAVLADGQTPIVLAAALSQAYDPYLQRPNVDVIVTSALSQQVFMGGEVQRPGPVVLQPGMTIAAALTVVGGLKDSAAFSKIVLLRRDGAGVEQAYRIDVKSALNGTDLTQNIALLPRDIIVAPKSGIANVNMYVKQYLRDNIPVGVGGNFPI